MLCCNDPSPHYSPVNSGETGRAQQTKTDRSVFPGMNRTVTSDMPPQGSMLIKTGGTALQAVSREEALQDNMVAVSVPENVKPGQEILVTAPDGSGRCMRATVPEGALPGHTFLVKFEPEATTHPVVAVMGIPVEQDLLLNTEEELKKNEKESVGEVSAADLRQNATVVGTPVQETQQTMNEQAAIQNAQQPSVQAVPSNHQQQNDSRRILVKVPPGVFPGEKIRVKIPDGRTIEETVPNEDGITQFYLQVPPKNQNWHDNPLAYGAPMIAAPFLL